MRVLPRLLTWHDICIYYFQELSKREPKIFKKEIAAMLKAAANAKMVKKTITLNNGVEMPMVGFGTYQITDPEVCAETVSNAIKVGYHLIDAAPAYGN